MFINNWLLCEFSLFIWHAGMKLSLCQIVQAAEQYVLQLRFRPTGFVNEGKKSFSCRSFLTLLQ